MRVDEVRWDDVTDSYGPATAVGEALTRLLGATDRAAAHKAGAEVLDRTTDGTAISAAVPPTVACLLPAVGDPGYRWTGEVLYVLDVFAFVLGAWEAQRATASTPAWFDEQVGWEAEARRLLAGSTEVRGASASADPEVRTLATRIAAATAADPGKALAALEQRFDAETDPTARACLAEAIVLLALERGNEAARQGVPTWVAAHTTAADHTVATRLRRLLPDQVAGGTGGGADAWFPSERA